MSEQNAFERPAKITPLNKDPRMRFSSGTNRWWVAAFLAVTLVCTTGWLILSQRLAEQTGLRRQVWLANDFQGTPVINDVAREPTLDFLDDDPRLPREFISARWRGYWYVPSRWSFTLHVEADDYADIWIDGEQRFTRSSAAERAVRLDAGVHELQIVFQQYAGAANLALTGGSGDAYPLPLRTGYLFPTQPEPNLLRLVGIVDRLTLTVGILWAAGALAAAVFILWRRRTAVVRALGAAVFILWGRRDGNNALPAAAPIRLEGSRTRTTIAVLLGLLFVGHVGVFGWRSITFDRHASPDSMNYIDVARNLSAGEGLVQSAAGFNQPTFWAQDFSPHVPDKTRAGHNPGYAVLIAAVAAATGLEHADAAFVIGPAAYAAALLFTFLFASRLLGTAAGLLAAAFFAHQLRWIFLRTWTEPVVIALLLALLALLARGATPRRAVGVGLLVGVALLVRNSGLPLLALGGLACVLGGDNRLRQLLLFGGGASIALAGLLLGEGQAYPPQIIIEAGEFPRQELSNVLGELFRQTRWDIAGLVLLVGCAGWRAVRDGRPIVPTRARTACLLAAAWVAGSCVFLSAAQLVTVIDPIGDRLLAPARAVTAVISALLVWRLCPERLRLSVAVVVFAATTALATAGDAIVQGDTGTAQRLYASSARVLVGRNMTARILPADGDRSDYAFRTANPRRLWVSRNVTPRDLVVGARMQDLPYLFRQQVPATVSFSSQPYFPEISGAKFNAIFLARCGRYDNLYLILSKLGRRWGRFALDLVAGSPAEPGTPAANFARVADLPDSVVFRFTACEE